MSIKGIETQVINDYTNGSTLSTLEKKYHTDYRVIKKVLLEHNIELRPASSYIKKQNIIGQKFGMLTAIEELESEKGARDKARYFLFKCDCGNVKKIRGDSVWRGQITNCGCITREVFSQKAKERFYKHGQSSSRLYFIWRGMKNRCLNKNHVCYNDYGGRGIKVCDEWKNSFIAFRDWALQNGFKDNLSIDRIDVNGNYEPRNCRWATQKQQTNNTRRNHYIVYKDIKATLRFWQTLLNIPHSTFYNNLLDYDWNLEQYLSEKGIEIKLNFEVIKK